MPGGPKRRPIGRSRSRLRATPTSSSAPSDPADRPSAPRLRPFDPGTDAETILGWLSSPEDVLNWNGRIPDEPLTASLLARWHADPDVRPYVLEAGEPLAYGELWVDHADPSIELAHLLVPAASRGAGRGKLLTYRLVAEATTLCDYPILLRVVPENARAISCYRACGFAPLAPERQEDLNTGEVRAYCWMAPAR